MKIFKIINRDMDMAIGYLLYYEKTKTFIIELSEKLDEWTAPLLLDSFVKKGIYTIPREVSYLFVKERILPPDRQNLNAILSRYKMKEYDECKLLELSKGICCQDNLCFEETDSLDDETENRRQKNLKNCTCLDHYRILCIFNDGSVKIAELKDFRDIYHIDLVLENEELFHSCQRIADGYAISFNDSIDISSLTLYEKSYDTGLNYDDLLTFVKGDIIDTGDACKLLACTRQNMTYLLSKETVSPIKNEVNGKLFLKGDIEKNTW